MPTSGQQDHQASNKVLQPWVKTNLDLPSFQAFSMRTLIKRGGVALLIRIVRELH